MSDILEYYRALFKKQADKAIEFSGDTSGINALQPLLERIEVIEDSDLRLPFAIVVPGRGITISRRMKELVFNGILGKSHLRDDSWENRRFIDYPPDPPQIPYLAVDVRYLGLPDIEGNKLHYATAIEGITAVMYKPYLLSYYSRLHICGSGSTDKHRSSDVERKKLYLHVGYREATLNSHSYNSSFDIHHSLCCKKRLAPLLV